MLYIRPHRASEHENIEKAYWKDNETIEPTSDVPTVPPPSVISGRCACGQVIFHSATPPLSITLCHCVECRTVPKFWPLS